MFAEKTGVKRIVAETLQGSLGLLPNRLDCAAVLKPGILTYETDAGGQCYVAADQGVLVKTGADVLISVRNAIEGTDLARLHEAVVRQFLDLNDQEKKVRAALVTMESVFIRRLMDIEHG